MLVEHERCRDVANPVAQDVEPPTEVDILVEHEHPLVEATDLAEDLAADHHRGARREHHIGGGLAAAVVRRSGHGLVTHPEPGQRRVHVVDVHAVPVEDLAGDATDRAIVFQRADGGPQPIDVGAGVVVDEREVFAGGMLGGQVAPGGETAVGRRLDQRDLWRQAGPQDLDAVIARGVVDTDDLESVGGKVVGVGVEQCPDAGERVLGAAEVHDADRDDTRPGLAAWSVHGRVGTSRSAGAAASAKGPSPGPFTWSCHWPSRATMPPDSRGSPRSTSKRRQ